MAVSEKGGVIGTAAIPVDMRIVKMVKTMNQMNRVERRNQPMSLLGSPPTEITGSMRGRKTQAEVVIARTGLIGSEAENGRESLVTVGSDRGLGMKRKGVSEQRAMSLSALLITDDKRNTMSLLNRRVNDVIGRMKIAIESGNGQGENVLPKVKIRKITLVLETPNARSLLRDLVAITIQ